MNYLLLSCIALFLCSVVPKDNNSGKVTSIKDQITIYDDTVQYYFDMREHDKALIYVDMMSDIASKSKDNYYIALTEYNYGTIYLWQDNYAEAYNSLISAHSRLEDMSDDYDILMLKIRVNLSLGACYLKTMMMSAAYEVLMRGMELNKTLGDRSLQMKLENNILVCYREMGKHREVIQLSRKMLTDIEDPYLKFVTYIRIMDNYNDLMCYDSSMMYVDSAFLYANSDKDISYCYMCRGNINRDIGDYKKAASDYDSSMRYIDDDDTELYSNMLVNLGYVSMKQGYNDQALNYIDRGIELAKKHDVLYIQHKALKYRAFVFAEMERHKEAYQNMAEYISLSDSIIALKDIENLQRSEMQYHFDAVQANIKHEMYKEKTSHQRHQWALYMVIMVLVFIVVTILLLLNRKSILLQKRRIEQDSLTKELDYRNREMTAKALEQVKRKELLDDIISKLTSLKKDNKTFVENVDGVIRELRQCRDISTPDDFDYYFTQTHPSFYERLSADYPHLTSYELHLCAYLKLNLSTKEIATICNIVPSSVRQAKYRLRQSLNADDADGDLQKILSKY